MSQHTKKDLTKALLEAIESGSFTVFPKYYPDFADKWDYFINFIDYGSQQPMPEGRQKELEAGHDNSEFRKGLVGFWGYMTMLIDRPTEDFFPGLKKIKSDLASIFNKDPVGAIAIVSISSSEKKIHKHEDTTDNIYIQCVGSVTWRVYVEGSEKHIDHELGPGDIIFIPSGISHEVFPKTARGAVAFSFDPKA